jgi:purine-nucleoside phosphorylase
MSDLTLRLVLTKNYLTKLSKLRPKIAIVLGSGFSAVADMIESGTAVAYKDIPNFPVTTVPGHKGRVIFGQTREHTPILVFDGRPHYYEGLTMQQVAYPVYVAQALGATVLIVTNAAGGISEEFSPGDIMVIRDHINLLGDNPLRGPQTMKLGERFPALRDAYDPQLLDRALRSAQTSNIVVRLGVYAAVSGPSFETDAELHALHTLGADAVGMSTVPEVIAARHAGLRVLGISIIANDAMPRRRKVPAALDHAAVLLVVEQAASRVRTLLEGVIEGLDA